MILLFKRKMNYESRTIPNFTLNADISAVALNNAKADWKTESCANCGAFGRKERIEEPLHILPRDAATAICHRYFNKMAVIRYFWLNSMYLWFDC